MSRAAAQSTMRERGEQGSPPHREDVTTQAQGANFHCQPTGRQLTHTQMLDWLADHLPPRQA